MGLVLKDPSVLLRGDRLAGKVVNGYPTLQFRILTTTLMIDAVGKMKGIELIEQLDHEKNALQRSFLSKKKSAALQAPKVKFEGKGDSVTQEERLRKRRMLRKDVVGVRAVDSHMIKRMT